MKSVIQQIDTGSIPGEYAKRDSLRTACAVAGLLAICGVVFFFGLGHLSLIGPDEPRFAEVAREMFATGDYITPRVAGVVAFDKPVLLYWAMAASYHAFGVTEFAARLPSALAALACVFFTYYAIASRLSRRLALIASAVLATNFFFIGFSRAVIMDMVFTATMCAAALCLYLCATETGRARSIYWALGAAATGVGVLAKGLAAIALVCGILAVSYFVTRQPKSIKWRDWAIGGAIFLAVISIWYVPVIARHGHEFIDEFIIKHHFRRFLTNRYQHPQPLWFYPAITLAGLLPWTFFLLPAAARVGKIRPRSGDRKDYLLSLAWVWFLVTLVFFSLSQSKLPSYILPAFPALAIIIAVEVERVWNGEKDRLLTAARWLTAAALVLFSLAFLIYLNRESLLSIDWRLMIGCAPLAIALFVFAMLVMGKHRAAMIGALATVSCLVIAAALVILPHLDGELGLKQLSLDIKFALKPKEKMAFYMNKNYAPVFYAEGRAVSREGLGEGLNAYLMEELVSSLEAEKSLIVITSSNYERDITDNPRFHAELIARQGTHCAFRVLLASPSQ